MRALPYLLLALVTVACGGSGSPTAPPPIPPPSAPSIQFTADGAAGANSIFMTAPDGQRLVLEVRANSVGDLYGVSFDLTFPAGLLTYNGVTEGTFLSQGGNSTSLQVAESSGRLVVGISRLGSVPGAGGSGLLATFEFVAAGNGGGALRFAANTAFNSSGGAKTGVAWVGGTVQVTQ